MKISRNWNKFWIGLALGIFLPVVFFVTIYLIGYSKISFVEFVKFKFMMKMLPKIISLCVVPNLAVFYFFLNREFWYATRGIILATILSTLSIFLFIIL